MLKPQRLDDDCPIFPSAGVFGACYCRTCAAVELSTILDSPDDLDDFTFWRQLKDEPYCLYSAENIDRRLYNAGDSEYMGKLIALVSADVLAKLKPCKKEIVGEGSGLTVVKV